MARRPGYNEQAFPAKGEAILAAIEVPRDLDAVLDAAWEAARNVPGFLMEAEARLLGTIAACAPAGAAIVEIGSFKGKSTVMLAKVAAHYGLGKVVAIDPHNFNSEELAGFKTGPEATSYREFLSNLEAAGVTGQVEVHRAFSTDVAHEWNRPIAFLWIDGDHSYKGAKADFDGFFPHVVPQGIVALHDALHEFSGPIRVFVEEMLRSNRFGAAGFVGSIAWSQFRPEDGSRFQRRRAELERPAARLIPLVKDERELHGLAKLRFKLSRSRVPRKGVTPGQWASLLEG
jgi:predicted O-methyltransferase YrrM